MTGISEILVLLLLIVCVLILPRLFKGESSKKAPSIIKFKKLTAKIRFGVILTFAYPVVMALYFKPWDDGLIPYISFGVIPVFLAWGIVWVMGGKKKI